MSTWYINDAITFGHGESLALMQTLEDASVDLVLSDTPWNTGVVQELGGAAYADSFVDFKAFMVPRLTEMRRILTDQGTCIIHMGPKEAHNVKGWMDQVFGASNFYGEIITYGELGRGSGACVWTLRHSYIFIYHKKRGKGFVDPTHLPRVDRKAPKGAQGTQYADETKPAFSVIPWTMSNSDPQRVKYPSQKPLGLYKSLVQVHCPPGGLVLDPFAGSGTTGAAAQAAGCYAILLDQNDASLAVCTQRLGLSADTTPQ